MGAYQPSNAVSMARSAGTTANSIAIDSHGREAAVFASGAAVARAAGAATKQHTTRTISIKAIVTLMIAVSVLPSLSPIQWIAVKATRIATASARGLAVAPGQRMARKVTVVIDT